MTLCVFRRRGEGEMEGARKRERENTMIAELSSRSLLRQDPIALSNYFYIHINVTLKIIGVISITDIV